MMLLTFLLTALWLPTGTAQDAEAQVRAALDQVVRNDVYEIHSTSYATDTKTLSGDVTFFGQQRVTLAASLDGDNKLSAISFTFPKGNALGIKHSAWKGMAGRDLAPLVPQELETALQLRHLGLHVGDDRKVSQVDMGFTALRDWAMLSGSAMELKRIEIDFEVLRPTDSKKRTTVGTLTGVTRLGSVPLDVTAELPEDRKQLLLTATTRRQLAFVSALDDMVGRKAIAGITVPNYAVDFKIDRLQLGIRPHQKMLHLDGDTNWGTVAADVWRTKGKKAKTEYTVALQIDKDAKLSKLSPKLTLLDAVPLGGQKIVITSVGHSKKKTRKLPTMAGIKSALAKGCHLVANIDLKAIGMAALTQMEEIEVTTLLDNQLAGVVLTGDMETNLPVGPTTQLKNVEFRLTPAPSQFAVALVGKMDVAVEKDILDFGGGMEVGVADQSLNLLGSSETDWDAPFGVKGLTVRDMQLQFGASFTTAPVILPKLGVSGDLDIGGVIGRSTLVFDTRNPQRSMIDAQFSRLNMGEIYEVLIPSPVRRKTPKSAIQVMRGLELQDVQFRLVPVDMVAMGQSYEAGFTVGGGLAVGSWRGDALIDIDPKSGFSAFGTMDPIRTKVLKIEGADGRAKPVIDVLVRKGEAPQFLVNGRAVVLGISAETEVELLDKGLRFMVAGKVFDVFEASVDVRGRNLDRAEDLQVDVKLRNDALRRLTASLSDEIDRSTAESVKKISKMQRDIDKAKKDVDGWDVHIAALRKQVDKEQAGDRKKVRDAKRGVEAAQKKVNGIKKAISKKNRELKRTPKTLGNAIKRGKIRTELGALHSSLFTANRALDAARLFLKGLHHLNVNPDADPRMVSARASQKTAQGTLIAARTTLEVYKKTRSDGGKLASFIVKEGLGKAVDIRSADFSGKLGTLHGAKVNLKMKVMWMGKLRDVNFRFNMKNPKDAVADLLKELRKGSA